MDMPNLRIDRPLSSLKKQVVETIRDAILDLRFKPGDRLVEREMCERLGVSRTLLREAMSQLEAEGFVQIIPHRGPIVAVYTFEDAKATYEIRAVIEELAGRLFAQRAKPEDREELDRAFRELKRAYRSKENSDRLSVKAKFYTALVKGTANPMLMDMLKLIHGRVTMLRATTLSQPGRLAQSIAELAEVVSMANAGDAEGAARACRRHVENAAELALRILSTEQRALEPATPKRRTSEPASAS